jgi:hypothetical protein
MTRHHELLDEEGGREKMKKEEYITKLTSIWMECLDYHKDRDCHWYVQLTWSYGDEPYWEAQHYGYVYEPEPIQCKSYDEALDELIKMIKEGFKNEIEHAEYVLSESGWDKYDIKHAELVIKKMKPEI